MLLLASVSFSFFVLSKCESVFRDVITEQGPVRGFNVDDNEVFSFYGIPYAIAPIGEDRFKESHPPSTWTETFNATEKTLICPQGNLYPNFTRTFNCLLINVFVPDTHETNLPVYVFVHGGGYQFGHFTEWSYIDLVKRGIIVVNFNYRLGLHGFLCLGTAYAPGNAGLKDQSAAIKWVKKNIAYFGGNPDTITIGGPSAGSSAAELQLLSPMSDGLFTKVILESGSTLAAPSYTSDPIQIAELFANSRGVYTNQSVEELENFFRSLSDDDMNVESSTIYFVPCIETHNLTGVEKFLSGHPIDIMREGRYEQKAILTGFTAMEGLNLISSFHTDASLMAANFSDFLPANIVFESTEQHNEVVNKVKTLYFPTGEITETGYVDYRSDTLFAYPQYLSARLQASYSMPVYLYLFSFNGTLNLPGVQTSPLWGPGHIAQSLYIFDTEDSTVYQPMTQNDYLIQERLRTMWYNFIVYGEPIPSRTNLLDVDWEALNNDHHNFLDIDVELTIGQKPFTERFALWDEIYGHFQEPSPDSAVTFKLPPSILLVIAIFIILF